MSTLQWQNNRSFLATFFFPSSLRKQKADGGLQEYGINYIFSYFFSSKIFFIWIYIVCYQKSLGVQDLGGGWFVEFYKNDVIFGNIVDYSEKNKFFGISYFRKFRQKVP